MVSPQSISKFREIYRNEFNIELTQEEAALIAEHFLKLARIVMLPIPKRYEARYRKLLEQTEKTPMKG